MIDIWGISCEIAQLWMSLDFTYDQSTLVQLMAWCCQETSHYLSQCWHRYVSPYGVTRPEWDKCIHWNGNVVTLMKFSSLAALEVAILTTFSAASDENFIKMMTFPVQCYNVTSSIFYCHVSTCCRCAKWVQNMRRDDLQRKTSKELRNYKLCADHFESSQFKNPDKR